jgi:hypothetical protein
MQLKIIGNRSPPFPFACLTAVRRGNILGSSDGAVWKLYPANEASGIDGDQATRRRFARRSKPYVVWVNARSSLVRQCGKSPCMALLKARLIVQQM